MPAWVAATPPCTRVAAPALSARALRLVLRAAARGTVPEASASGLAASCAIGRGEIADTLNRGGLRAHRERDYGRAVRLWELALGVDPSKTAPRYNLACGYALTGRRDDALALLQELRRAGEAGARWLARARDDGDLASLRADPRFVAAVSAGGDAPGAAAAPSAVTTPGAAAASSASSAPGGASPSSAICREIGDPDSTARCVVRPGGQFLPGGGRVDVAEVESADGETIVYLVFQQDDLVTSEQLATASDVPGETRDYLLGNLEVTETAVSVTVTQTTVTTGNTGDPDSDAQIVTDRVVSRVLCTSRDAQWTCEPRVTSRRCAGSHGAPRWYVRSICD